ncbi:MAG: phosphoadenosine phosphosulfate reductase family protein [Magnetococcales bacterium]|nr:phosphoadenosine phosphosulfate reductase family protein [Magnetococcales bacterium]
MTNVLTEQDLQERYAWGIDRKIEESCNRIVDWYSRHNGHVCISFSGGLDSTVLLDLVRNKCGYEDVPAVFSNTGLEFPENVQFVRSFANVVEVRPRRNFRQVIEKFGYPVVSKRVAQYAGEVQRAKGDTATLRLRMTGVKSDGSVSKLGELPEVWKPLVSAPFKVSDACCRILKKEPLRRVQKMYGPPFIGTRAQESKQRELTYKTTGCNAYHLAEPHSTPIAFWTHADVKEYIKRESLPYSKLYDMGYTRSGCMWCMFGAHYRDDDRFCLLEVTHPKIYRYCKEKLKLFDVLDFIVDLWENRFKRKRGEL